VFLDDWQILAKTMVFFIKERPIAYLLLVLATNPKLHFFNVF